MAHRGWSVTSLDLARIWGRLWTRGKAEAACALTPESEEIWTALESAEDVFLVQVGSNDGVQGDPLHPLIRAHPGWRGLFIEPVPYQFERLRRNYVRLPAARSRFSFENVAIAAEPGRRPFYYVSEQARARGDDLPIWCEQLGSFDREHIVSHLEGRLAPHIVEQDVECATLSDVLVRNRVERLDLLHVDTEGYDYEVLLQLDWQRWRPRVIVFEVVHLTEPERAEAVALLRSQSYRLSLLGYDLLATCEGPRCGQTDDAVRRRQA
jgi:FkbM family methyltransferase